MCPQGLFEPHLKRFFVRNGDPGYIRQLKLEILTSLASESNINIILRELQTYLRNADKGFVSSVIHALGRCAINVPDVADKCLAGLMRLIYDQNGTERACPDLRLPSSPQSERSSRARHSR